MEKMKYKISSRATILLGRESVSKVESALIELIKNTYDADATMCYILFDVENDSILLIDDGSGMTKKIIEDNWMMIGTDNKKKEYISKKKRIKSGEKGIGRFALDRLGGVCELFTKSQEEHATIRWKTNWNSFEEEGNLLEDIEAEFDQLKFTGGYDHNYVTDNYAKGNRRLIATAYSDKTGIAMDVTSDCPCVQFYAANFVENEHGKNGHTYNKRDAFCLETQVEPNAVNVEDFHSPILNAGEQYDSVTAYHFYIIK